MREILHYVQNDKDHILKSLAKVRFFAERSDIR